MSIAHRHLLLHILARALHWALSLATAGAVLLLLSRAVGLASAFSIHLTAGMIHVLLAPSEWRSPWWTERHSIAAGVLFMLWTLLHAMLWPAGMVPLPVVTRIARRDLRWFGGCRHRRLAADNPASLHPTCRDCGLTLSGRPRSADLDTSPEAQAEARQRVDGYLAATVDVRIDLPVGCIQSHAASPWIYESNVPGAALCTVSPALRGFVLRSRGADGQTVSTRYASEEEALRALFVAALPPDASAHHRMTVHAFAQRFRRAMIGDRPSGPVNRRSATPALSASPEIQHG